MLSASSWDTTQARMAGLIADVLGTRSGASLQALLVAAE
jgi:UDP-galactopyranose mutase